MVKPRAIPESPLYICMNICRGGSRTAEYDSQGMPDGPGTIHLKKIHTSAAPRSSAFSFTATRSAFFSPSTFLSAASTDSCFSAPVSFR
jgi:hypothetical protein